MEFQKNPCHMKSNFEYLYYFDKKLPITTQEYFRSEYSYNLHKEQQWYELSTKRRKPSNLDFIEKHEIEIKNFVNFSVRLLSDLSGKMQVCSIGSTAKFGIQIVPKNLSDMLSFKHFLSFNLER